MQNLRARLRCNETQLAELRRAEWRAQESRRRPCVEDLLDEQPRIAPALVGLTDADARSLGLDVDSAGQVDFDDAARAVFAAARRK